MIQYSERVQDATKRQRVDSQLPEVGVTLNHCGNDSQTLHNRSDTSFLRLKSLAQTITRAYLVINS